MEGLNINFNKDDRDGRHGEAGLCQGMGVVHVEGRGSHGQEGGGWRGAEVEYKIFI